MCTSRIGKKNPALHRMTQCAGQQFPVSLQFDVFAAERTFPPDGSANSQIVAALICRRTEHSRYFENFGSGVGFGGSITIGPTPVPS
jgi:hypothetical protein